MRLVAGAFVVAGLVSLALPSVAGAHGRGSAVALDFRLELDGSSLPRGVHVKVLDGDRALEARVDSGVDLLVRGRLREPLIRIGAGGVWVNASSPTATADGLVSPGRTGWVRVRRGRSLTWHDHRLAPPPVSTPGPAGSFSIPVRVDGRAAAIAGRFVRVPRPALSPWLAGAAVLGAGIAAAARRRGWRAALTIGVGVASGLAALAAVTTFAVRAAPTSGVAWLQLASGIVVAAALGVALVYLQGRSRVHAAGAVGVLAVAVSLSSLSIFWHGVVVSALPGDAARLVLLVALVGGAAAAALSFLPDFDEPAARSRR